VARSRSDISSFRPLCLCLGTCKELNVSKASVLIVDDEPGVRSALSGVLRDEGYAVEAVESGERCLDRVMRDVVDVIVLDVWLPGLDGLATLGRLRHMKVDSQVVMISGHGNIESAVKAIKMGAFDFVEKPLSLEKTVLVVRNALRQRRLEAENRALRARVDRAGKMVGDSFVMRQLREQVAMAAPTNGRVLIYGENGTGKELVARTIHAMSRRRNQPFVEVNCAAIPEELIESELFGHVKGAFTGAVADRKGKFEAATSGTIFLDEIGDMSIKTQAKVLRVLQEQVTEPVGSTSRVQVDVRVLAATNKDLKAEIRSGRFRDDLYFRLNVIPIFVPPLRERTEDIPLLAEHFVAEFALEYGSSAKTIDPRAMTRLQNYQWPGNVRELRNVIERVVIMAPGDLITERDLAFLSGDAAADKPEDASVPAVPLYTARDQFERDYILRELANQQGNISKTAEVLGVERSNLYRKMRAFGIAPRRSEISEGSSESPESEEEAV
jgi:two-component system nitrogen regulation response regulator NtrX